MILRLKFLLFCSFSFFALGSNAQADFVFADAVKPVRFSAPINLKDSLPKVTVSLNGKNETFIVDNGAPYLVINWRNWQREKIYDSSIKARGIGGAVQSGVVAIDSFNWQGISKSRFKAVASELPYLGDSIAGLLGYDIFKDYRLSFDYKNKMLIFVKSDSTILLDDSNDSVFVSPISMSKHLPVLLMVVGSDSLKMAIDCASSINIVYSKHIVSFKTVKNIQRTLLHGSGGIPIVVQKGILPEAYVNKVRFLNMLFTFDDYAMEQVNYSLENKIDGLLGYPFLKQYKISIDYTKQLLIINPK